MLSAQTTDAQVNKVTPELFRRWPTPEAMAGATYEELSEVIKMCIRDRSMGLLDQLNAMLDQTKSALASSDETLADLQATLETVKTDIVALRSSEAAQEFADLLDMDPANIADFMSAPVTLTTKAVYPVENYGSGVTPFYTNLALWVGGFVLIAIFKLEVDTEGVGQITANQGYFCLLYTSRCV